MDSNVEQTSFQPIIQVNNEIEPETRTPQSIYNLNQLKSFEILRSALTIFTTNFKFMFLMILSLVSLFAFMIFFEIKLQTIIKGFPHIFEKPYKVIIVSSSDIVEYGQYGRDQEDDIVYLRKNFFYNLVQVCVFYIVVYPLLEILSIIVTVKYSAKIQSRDDTQMSLKDALYKNNFNAVLVTYLSVHLLSGLTLLGLIWAVLNHRLFSSNYWLFYGYQSFESLCFNLLSVGFHSAIFIGLLYVYMGWSALWNMSIVISILEEVNGFGAFGLSDYYGKHYKKTGFQLMAMFFAFGNVLRVPSLFFGLCKLNFAGVLLTSIVIGFVCFGNLVKWIALVLYFYDCKKQVMEKKGDEQVAKSVKKDDSAC